MLKYIKVQRLRVERGEGKITDRLGEMLIPINHILVVEEALDKYDSRIKGVVTVVFLTGAAIDVEGDLSSIEEKLSEKAFE